MSKLIFELTKVHVVLQFIYSRLWQSLEVLELRVLDNVAAEHKVKVG